MIITFKYFSHKEAEKKKKKRPEAPIFAGQNFLKFKLAENRREVLERPMDYSECQVFSYFKIKIIQYEPQYEYQF